MRLSLRFVLPLLIVLALVAYGVVPLVDALTLKWFTRDLESRSKLLASTMEVPLAELVATKAKAKIFTYFHKVIQDERLYALGFCDLQDRLLYQTLTFPDQLSCESLGHLSPGSSEVVKLPQGLACFQLSVVLCNLGETFYSFLRNFLQPAFPDRL